MRGFGGTDSAGLDIASSGAQGGRVASDYSCGVFNFVSVLLVVFLGSSLISPRPGTGAKGGISLNYVDMLLGVLSWPCKGAPITGGYSCRVVLLVSSSISSFSDDLLLIEIYDALLTDSRSTNMNSKV